MSHKQSKINNTPLILAFDGRETSSGQSAIAHESPLAGKTPAAIWRYAPHVAPGKTTAITVKSASFYFAGATQNWPTSLMVAELV